MLPTLQSSCFAEVATPEQNLGATTFSNEYQLTRKIQNLFFLKELKCGELLSLFCGKFAEIDMF